jgi:hypothetical protein
MGSVTSLPSGLADLTQPGGLLSSLSSAISTSQLQSSSPEDLVSLSLAALQAQEADGLLVAAPAADSSILSGIASADLTDASPREKAELSNQEVRFQQVEALFDPPPPTFNLIA